MAPYEADAQLTYLQKEGIVDFVITEDSDMLVFGCTRVGQRCSQIVFGCTRVGQRCSQIVPVSVLVCICSGAH